MSKRVHLSGLWHERWPEDGGRGALGRGAARSRPAATGEESNDQHIKAFSNKAKDPMVFVVKVPKNLWKQTLQKWSPACRTNAETPAQTHWCALRSGMSLCHSCLLKLMMTWTLATVEQVAGEQKWPKDSRRIKKIYERKIQSTQMQRKTFTVNKLLKAWNHETMVLLIPSYFTFITAPVKNVILFLHFVSY